MGLSSFHTSTIVQVVFAAAGAGVMALDARLGSLKKKAEPRRSLQSIVVFVLGAGLSLTVGLPTARYAMGSQPGAFAHVAAAGFSAFLAFLFGFITHEVANKILG